MVVSTAQSMFYNLEKLNMFSNKSLVNLLSNLTNERKIYYIHVVNRPHGKSLHHFADGPQMIVIPS